MVSPTNVISMGGRNLLTFPALVGKGESFTVLDQPPDVSFLIGLFLDPTDLARSQKVNKAWYWTFGRDTLWLSHHSTLFPPTQKEYRLKRPPKVEVVYQILLRKCWEEWEVDCRVMERYDTGGTISPDGSCFVTFGKCGRMDLWKQEVSDKQFSSRTLATYNTNDQDINGAIFSRDGSTVYTFGDKGTFGNWRLDPTDTSFVPFPFSSNENYFIHTTCNIKGAVSSGDGNLVLTFGARGIVGLWRMDSNSGVELTVGSHKLHEEHDVYSAAIAPNGKWALTVSYRTVVFWRGLDSGTISAIRADDPHGDSMIFTCDISPDGLWALTGGERGRLVKWTELEGEHPIGTLIAGREHPRDPHRSRVIKKVKISSDGRWVISAGVEGIVLWTDLQEEEWTFQVNRSKAGYSVKDILIPADRSWVVTLGDHLGLWTPRVELFDSELERTKIIQEKEALERRRNDCSKHQQILKESENELEEQLSIAQNNWKTSRRENMRFQQRNQMVLGRKKKQVGRSKSENSKGRRKGTKK